MIPFIPGRAAGWTAFDLRKMCQGYFDRGFAPTETEVARLTNTGHSPRGYEDFAAEGPPMGPKLLGLKLNAARTIEK